MKKSKNIFLMLCASFALSFGATAQNTAGKADDMGRLTLAAHVPKQIDQMPEAARSMLSNKISQIVTQNGMGGSARNERFILTANIVIMTKDILPGPPPMHAYTLDITFYIGDGIEGTKFASKSVSVKGVGTNETKAYIDAIKMVKPTDPALQSFVEEGKKKIMAYYNSKCDFIIKEAQTMASQDKYDEAIFKLVSVPDVCKECFDKCMAAVAPMYQKKIDRECKLKLAEATGIWNASQDMAAADNAGAILAQIEPSASCYGEAKALHAKIAKKVNEIDKREWAFKVKEQQQTSEMIKAYRDIGVAYGNNQPQTVSYTTIGWW